MSDQEQGTFFEEDDLGGVEPITMHNPMEESANRYWRASRIWRDREESAWTTGDMIQELRGMYRYRGLAPMLAERLMEDVIHDRRPITENPYKLTQIAGQ
jgi:hypothetical protein